MFWNISVSVGDVGTERNVQAGANSDPRGEIWKNVYWIFKYLHTLCYKYYKYYIFFTLIDKFLTFNKKIIKYK